MSKAVISSGALPKFASRKPPTPGPGVTAACSVASPIEPRQREERGGGEDEEQDVARIGREMDGDGQSGASASPP